MPAPDVAALKQFLLERFGLVVTGDATLGAALANAVARLEVETGYRPFVASDTESEELVEVEDGVALFPNGAVDGFTVEGYTEGLHYRATPTYGVRSQGLRWLRARRPEAPVAVSARWGWGDDYPPDVWQALVYFAAAEALAGRLLGDVLAKGAKWVDGDVSVSYADAKASGAKGLAALTGGQLHEEALEVFRRYRRTAVWG